MRERIASVEQFFPTRRTKQFPRVFSSADICRVDNSSLPSSEFLSLENFLVLSLIASHSRETLLFRTARIARPVCVEFRRQHSSNGSSEILTLKPYITSVESAV